jgi:xanthine dehydrogenase accessory factor
MRLEVLKAMNLARRERRAGAVVTRLSNGEQRFVGAESVDADPFGPELETALRMGKSATVVHEGEDYFLTVQAPAARLALIGAVHISQALAPIARIAGLDVTIIDPRTAFATPGRFPDTPVIARWPDEALAEAPLDRFTAICLLTHDPKIDDPALMIALKADCFYIGALGSRKTHGRRIERMRAQGFDEAALKRIHAPIGLDIGAVSPAEIAVSIMGEIVTSLRKKPLRAESAAA